MEKDNHPALCTELVYISYLIEPVKLLYVLTLFHLFSQGFYKVLCPKLGPQLGRLNWRPIFDRILDLVAHHRCLHG